MLSHTILKEIDKTFKDDNVDICCTSRYILRNFLDKAKDKQHLDERLRVYKVECG